MTSTRLLACTLVLAFGACATPGRVATPTMPALHELCGDRQFDCAPSATGADNAIRIDTNLAVPQRTPLLG